MGVDSCENTEFKAVHAVLASAFLADFCACLEATALSRTGERDRPLTGDRSFAGVLFCGGGVPGRGEERGDVEEATALGGGDLGRFPAGNAG